MAAEGGPGIPRGAEEAAGEAVAGGGEEPFDAVEGAGEGGGGDRGGGGRLFLGGGKFGGADDGGAEGEDLVGEAGVDGAAAGAAAAAAVTATAALGAQRSLEIIGVVRQKYVFKNRPNPVVTSLPPVRA